MWSSQDPPLVATKAGPTPSAEDESVKYMAGPSIPGKTTATPPPPEPSPTPSPEPCSSEDGPSKLREPSASFLILVLMSNVSPVSNVEVS